MPQNAVRPSEYKLTGAWSTRMGLDAEGAGTIVSAEHKVGEGRVCQYEDTMQ